MRVPWCRQPGLAWIDPAGGPVRVITGAAQTGVTTWSAGVDKATRLGLGKAYLRRVACTARPIREERVY